EEFEGGSLPGPVQDSQIEGQRNHHPDDTPGPCLVQRNGMRPAMKHAEVHRQHQEHERVESDPKPGRAHLSRVPGKYLCPASSRHAASVFAGGKKRKRGKALAYWVAGCGSRAFKLESSMGVGCPACTVTGRSQRRWMSPATASVSSVLSQ